MEKRFYWSVSPVADERNTVIGDHWRFTVLRPQLIRMEYSADGIFEDRASQSVFYRNFPENKYSVSEENGILLIDTGKLLLKYSMGMPFDPNTLSVKLNDEPGSIWRFGEPFETLGGTAKTLDTVNDRVPIGDGVCSRTGFSVINDSNTLVLNEEGWIEPRNKGNLDLYFFGYGYEYKKAVRDYFGLTGTPPLLPAYALGNWWSRYHRYTQESYIELMDKFREEDIPFTVAVLDMDWHIVDIPKELLDEETEKWKGYIRGWTGYTWNRELFPDYRKFLKELHNRDLKTALNLHPVAGVCRHEAQYSEMAGAMGVTNGKRVPFDILSIKYMQNYFDILHHPYENDGVDFWWMDWQQGSDYWWIHERNKNGALADPRETLDPLWMLNHLHILDISRNGKRPMFFSRFSGYGSQRYPVGFSGDTIITWEALRLQPYFTATASNIGYCWWSHDIGGHMLGYSDPELTVRWMQFGVFSPINRLHSTDDEFIHKEPWKFEPEYCSEMKKALRLRHRLFPYLYAMNYRCHMQLEPLIQPMYYLYPKRSAAYEVPGQYWFGSELMVSAITEKCAAVDHLAKCDIWLPEGEWFDLFSGVRYSVRTGRKTEIFRALGQYAVFAKAGAIIPLMRTLPHSNSQAPSENMELIVFPGADNGFDLYEDEGDGTVADENDYAKTHIELLYSDETAVITVEPAVGKTSVLPQRRNWLFSLRGFNRESNILISVNGRNSIPETSFDEKLNTVCLKAEADINEKIVITVSADSIIKENYDVIDLCKKILDRSEISTDKKARILSVVSDSEASEPHAKLLRLFNSNRDEFHLLGAIRELLTLRRDEFDSDNGCL